MGTTFWLDFYVVKEPLVRSKLQSLLDLMAEHSFRPGAPSPSEPSAFVPGVKIKELAELGTEQLIDLIVDVGEGSITFTGPSGDVTIYLRPMGSSRNKTRARGPNEEIPLGVISLIRERIYEEDFIRKMFASSVEVGTSLYHHLKPVYGFTYLDGLSEAENYNLIPTPNNILEHGPRDFFPINFWSPTIASKIEWSQLEGVPHVRVEELEDGGVLAYVEPDHYALESGGGCPHWVDAEIVLGWRGDLDVETYRSLIQYVEMQKRKDPEALARRLGLSEEAIAGGSDVVARAGLSPGDFLNRILLGWREYAIEIARRVRSGEVEVDPDDEEHLEDVFEAFVEQIGRR